MSIPVRRPTALRYSDGTDLPAGWEIETMMDDSFSPVIRYRARKGGTVYTEHASRLVVENFVRDITADEQPAHLNPIESLLRQPAAAAPAEPVAPPRVPAKVQRTREGLWFAVAAVTGLLVGGGSVGLVAANRAPEITPVTPIACTTALNYAEDIFESTGDGFSAMKLSQPRARAEAMRKASDETSRLSPLYEDEALQCRMQR